jgi:hypothetical protein
MPGERFARPMRGTEPPAPVDSPPAPEPPALEPTGPEPVVAAPAAAESAEPAAAESAATSPEPEQDAPSPEPRRPLEPSTQPAIHAQPAAPAAPPMFRQPARFAERGPHLEPRGRAASTEPPISREATPHQEPMERGASTAPQLRRFIKSRAYVPMHELRRRFGINGNDDDVTTIELERGRIYVGLPGPEGRLLGELLRSGDIGYELSMDPMSPIVVGVYPMRPVPRP